LSASLLDPWEKMIRIKVLGTDLTIPENNTLLRCFQHLYPETVSYGKFCWNDECGNSEFRYRLPSDLQVRVERACRFVPTEGIEIVELSTELKEVLPLG